MADLPKEFTDRMREELKDGFASFLETYNRPCVRGIRVNTLKISAEEFVKISPFELEPVPWEPDGFYCAEEKPGKTVEFAAGLIYPQEPSAMSAVPLLDVRPGDRVLDLCAAPGGKTTQIAQAMRGSGVLVANDISHPRAGVLSQNVERCGIRNCAVTCADPEMLVREFPEYFDKILVDAPCSGEGMFKKEPAALEDWSPDAVRACAERQARILECAYGMLCGGGRLVYSTCTFSEDEDEAQVRRFLERHRDCVLLEMKKLLPNEVRGEGHFAALMEKREGYRNDVSGHPGRIPSGDAVREYRSFEAETLSARLDGLRLLGDELYSVPDDFPDLRVPTLRLGIDLGCRSKGRFVPSHSLAMCCGIEAESIDVDRETAYRYLSGEAVACGEDVKGWRTVRYLGHTLGWCKATGGVAKNHYPKGLRIAPARP